MRTRTLTLLLALALVAAPAALAAPAAATHSCVDDVPCYPHTEPILQGLCSVTIVYKVLSKIGSC